MSDTSAILKAGLSDLFAQLKDIVGTLPDEAKAKEAEYQAELIALGKDVVSGAVSMERAKYLTEQMKNGLIQAIGSLGIDLAGKKKAAVEAVIRGVLAFALRLVTGGVA